MVGPAARDPEPVTLSAAAPDHLLVRLYTERYLVRGRLAARGGLLAALNAARGLLDLEEGVYDEFGSLEIVTQVPFVQVNLDLVLIAAPDEAWEPAGEASVPGLTPSSAAAEPGQEILVALPPFRVVGRLASAVPGADLRAVLAAGGGRFVRLDQAIFWSESLNEPRTRAPWLAVNRDLAHLMAPHRERDVWAGADGFTATTREPGAVDRPATAALDMWITDSQEAPSPVPKG